MTEQQHSLVTQWSLMWSAFALICDATSQTGRRQRDADDGNVYSVVDRGTERIASWCSCSRLLMFVIGNC